jgi:hypothetical protein
MLAVMTVIHFHCMDQYDECHKKTDILFPSVHSRNKFQEQENPCKAIIG